MAIQKTKNSTWVVNVYDAFGNRKVKRFKKKSDAIDYETFINNEKRENKLIGVNLKSSRSTMDMVMNEFLLNKQSLRKKSIQKYNNVIEQFRSYCKLNKINYLDQFTSDNATDFYNLITGISNELDSKDRPKPKTVNFYLASIRSMFKTQIEKGKIFKNPFDHVKNLRVEKKLPDYYSTNELKAFFEQEMDYQYRVAFMGLLHTGCRFEELANLKWEDIELKSRQISIRSKGAFQTKTFNSQRVIPLNKILTGLLIKMSASKKSNDYPFCSMSGNKLSERTLLTVCKRIAKNAGINSRVYLHKFRHTFASHLVQNGVPIEVIQKLLGHVSITETMIYAHLKPDSKHREVEVLDKIFDNN